ncbi:methyltransferase domain-containing protein [Bengtsoniella intestinalis]|uniref:putative RNA methyltransferase n=1 Tax=Bengtsoniella intestinalis TaxID=3073143 RepID=UPI00391F8753
MSLFICPVCREPLTRGEKSYTCPNGHSYDLAKEGHTYLLLANQKNSLQPGDDKAMARARTIFLDKGYYAPLRNTLCQLLQQQHPIAILDAGCGEGYYTAGIRQALPQAEMAGIDISKFCLQKGAKREKTVEFAVASSYHLPLADGSVDAIVNCFSPMATEEFARVLKPHGRLYYVVPGAEHLWALKQVLYDAPYLNEEKETPYADFCSLGITPVDFTMDIQGQEALQALLGMTPYAWKTPKDGKDRLSTMDALTVEASFRIHTFEKEDT